jgi:hypothetical protein
MLKQVMRFVTFLVFTITATVEVRGQWLPLGNVKVEKTPSIAITGRVVAPDGRPVTAFTVAAGPGNLPLREFCERRDIQDNDGRFRVNVSERGKTWVGIATKGYAAWEGWVNARGDGQPLQVRISPGVAVTATVIAPRELMKRVTGILFLRRDLSQEQGGQGETLAQELATRVASASPDGVLRFEHVRPDRYRFYLRVDGITRAVFAIDVPDADTDLGTVPFNVTVVSGRVEGLV